MRIELNYPSNWPVLSPPSQRDNGVANSKVVFTLGHILHIVLRPYLFVIGGGGSVCEHERVWGFNASGIV